MPNSDAYRFANTIWVEEFIGRRLDAASAKRACAFACAPWIIGFIIAAASGRAGPYLATPAFYIGSAGILLTTLGLVYGASQQYAIYDRLTSCYALTPESRRAYILRALEANSRFSHQVRAATVIFAIGISLITSSLFFWDNIFPFSNWLGTSLPRFHALAVHDWYSISCKWVTFWIVAIYLAFISPALGTSASIIIKMPSFLWSISHENPCPPPAFIKLYFGPAAAFHFFSSILWLICVGFVFYFIGSNHDWLSYFIVAFTFLLGIANLAIPQVAYLRTVATSEGLYMRYISSLHQDSTGDPSPNSSTFSIERSEFISSDSGTLVTLMRYEDWVYPNHQTYIFLGSYIVSLLGSIVGWSKLYAILKLN